MAISLSEEQANGISEVLTKVHCLHMLCDIVNCRFVQAFKGRLLEVIDQAQHFAALGPAGGGGPSTDTAQSFREGRSVVFALAQESAKRMKRWHEGNDKARR